MKKLIAIILSVILIATVFTGCSSYDGYDFVDTNYHFDRAIIKMPDGTTQEIKVKAWADAEGEQLTITDTEGHRYLVHAANCILIED